MTNYARLEDIFRSNVRAAGSGTVTLTAKDMRHQIFSLTADSDVVLPSAGIFKGDKFIFENGPSGLFDLSVKASNLTTITGANAGTGSMGNPQISTGSCTLVALVNTPTLPSHWKVTNVQETWTFNLTGSGSFTGGTFIIARNNRVCATTVTGFTWSGSLGQVPSAISIIPSRLRPPSEADNIVRGIGGTSSVVFIEMRSDGQLIIYNRSNTNLTTSVNVTNPGGIDICMSYVTAL